MPCTVQPWRPDQIVLDSTFDSSISIQYWFKINSIFILSRLEGFKVYSKDSKSIWRIQSQF
jgi:hypothetical protein